MALGDKKFGPVAASEHVQGNGTELTVVTNFNPQSVIVLNPANNAMIYWTATMDNGSGYVISPAAVSSFAGNPLPVHTHTFEVISLNGDASLLARRIYLSSTTGFNIGDSVTNGTAATTIAAVGSSWIEVTGVTEWFYGQIITDTTSGSTATAVSDLVARVPFVTAPIFVDSVMVTLDSSHIGYTQSARGYQLTNTWNFRVHPSENFFELDISQEPSVTIGAYDIRYISGNSSVSAGTPSGTISGSGGGVYISSGGITPQSIGFTIGNEPLIHGVGNDCVCF